MDIREQIGAELDYLHNALNQSMSVSLRSRIPVEDVVHETYVRAVEAMDNFEYRDATRLRAWLLAIARNHIRSCIRRKAPQFGDIARDLVESGLLRPSEIMSKDEQIKRLESAIAKLPARHQDILRSRYREGMTFEAVAELRPESAAAVRGLHRNALDALRKLLNVKSVASE